MVRAAARPQASVVPGTRLTTLARFVAVCLVGPLQGAETTPPPPPPASSPLAFVDVTVVDVLAGKLLRGRTVVAAQGRITEVGPSAEVEIPAGCTRVDGSGRYLIPGLWDAHTHWYWEEYLPLFIANGVTGIRMMLGAPMHHAWRAAISRGTLLGPRLVIASRVLDGPEPIWPHSIAIASEEEARAAVRAARASGADFVKVYSLLPREAFSAIGDEARRIGIPFDGHVPDSVPVQEAARAGQRCIEHLTGVLIGCSNRQEELMEQLQETYGAAVNEGDKRPWSVASRRIAAALLESYDEEKAASVFALFRELDTWHCPTLTVSRSMGRLNLRDFVNDPRLAYMPPGLRQSWNPRNDFRLRDAADADFADRRRRFAREVELVGAMHRAGVRFLAGTDVGNPFCFPGFSLHDELELLVEAGMTAADALRTATIHPARFLDRQDSLGTIDTGRLADLVLLEANPLEDIRNTKAIVGVLAAGRWLDRPELDRILAKVKANASRESIGAVILETVRSSDVSRAIAQYRELRANQPDRYNFAEIELTLVGYALLGMDRVDDAIAIFELNAEMFPAAWNVYDSLAEAFLKQGNRESAARNYRRSLELNPKNEAAIKALETLEE